MEPAMSPAQRTAPKRTPPTTREENTATEAALTPLRGVTFRSVLLGLLLAVPNTYWITVVEVRWYTLDGTSLPLFITPIFFLFWLVLLNLGIRRLLPRAAPRLAFS